MNEVKQAGWFVKYNVSMGDDEKDAGPNYLAGPYGSLQEADEHRRDIDGYEGVLNCHIVWLEP